MGGVLIESLIRKFIADSARLRFWVVVEYSTTYIDVEISHGKKRWRRRRILTEKGGARQWKSVTSALAWLYKEGIHKAEVDLSHWQPGKADSQDQSKNPPEQHAIGF